MSLWRKKTGQEAQEPDMACWFCKKTRRYVRVLIAGPDGVNICEECVHICDDIIARRILEDPRNQGPLDVRGGELVGDTDSIQCGLCRMPGPLVGALAVPDRGVLCGFCSEAIADLLRDKVN